MHASSFWLLAACSGLLAAAVLVISACSFSGSFRQQHQCVLGVGDRQSSWPTNYLSGSQALDSASESTLLVELRLRDGMQSFFWGKLDWQTITLDEESSDTIDNVQARTQDVEVFGSTSRGAWLLTRASLHPCRHWLLANTSISRCWA
jgi:hypothetical protein